jgi:hypothetical protein
MSPEKGDSGMRSANIEDNHELSSEGLKLLRLLQSGRGRVLQSGTSFVLKLEDSCRPLARPMLRELLRLRLLVADGRGGLKLANPAETRQPGFNADESPLHRLRFRKDGKAAPYLSEQQFEAGERLRSDFERADFAARVTANWGAVRVDGGAHASISDNRIAHVTDRAIDARRRVHAAFDAVGPELAAVLYYVCCLAGGLEQAERFLALPPRSGKAILSLALTRLARHYRLLGSPPSIARAADIAHWALADYRPVIPPIAEPARPT